MSFIGQLKRRNVLRVGAACLAVGWLLVQVVETVAPAFGLGDAWVRYLVVLLVAGLIPVLVLSWVFELTSQGLKRDRDVDPSDSIAPRTAKRLDRIFLVALSLAFAYFAVDKFVLDPARDAVRDAEVAREARSAALVESYGDKSIALMPFANMSGDPGQEFFSDGISEELSSLLRKIPELRVISRQSAFAFKGKDVTLAEIAQQLNVAYILEGSVRQSGRSIRITTQLIDARSDTNLWSESYDRALDDIFAVQDEIAAAVVGELKVRLLGDLPKSRRTDPQAYTLVLEARQMLAGTSDDYERMLSLLDHAIAIDPRYVRAWTTLSWLYFRIASSPERSSPLTSCLD